MPAPNSAVSTERDARATRVEGVYLLTPHVSSGDFDAMLAKLNAALEAGISLVQFRSKADGPSARSASATDRLRQARAVQAIARTNRALFIVNDDVDLALELDADGVHLGRDDGDLAAARLRLTQRLLGVSCYNDLGWAHQAVDCGADLLAFGSMYPSITKPAADRAPPALLLEARRLFPQVRIVAIGGIDAGNIRTISAAGAHAAAVISAVFEAPDAGQAARKLCEEFKRGQAEHEPQRATV
jgi:thiamine-phosphate pyrophosphorylase